MKYLTTAIYAKLSGSLLDTDIGGRLYKGQAPQGAEYPYVVFSIISDIPEKTFTEDYENVLIQFSLFSDEEGSAEIEDMFAHLKTLYDECSLTITSSTLVWMKRQNAIQIKDDDVWIYHVDYEVLTSLN